MHISAHLLFLSKIVKAGGLPFTLASSENELHCLRGNSRLIKWLTFCLSLSTVCLNKGSITLCCWESLADCSLLLTTPISSSLPIPIHTKTMLPSFIASKSCHVSLPLFQCQLAGRLWGLTTGSATVFQLQMGRAEERSASTCTSPAQSSSRRLPLSCSLSVSGLPLFADAHLF